MLESFKRATVCCLLLSLIACGGGGSDNNYVAGYEPEIEYPDTPPETNPIDERVADLEVAASSRQIPSDGQTAVTISAIAKDANNNVINDTDVTFAVDSGATIDRVEETAGSAVKTATLIPGLNKYANRTLTVTVVAGNQQRNINVDVVGTNILVEGQSRVALNVAAHYLLTLVNSSGTGISNQCLDELSSSNGNMIELSQPSAGLCTNSNGEIEFYLTAVNSGDDILRASALGINYQVEISVSGENFTLDSSNEEVPLDTRETVRLSWQLNGVPQVNKLIRLNTTRGRLIPESKEVITDSNGSASFQIYSDVAGGAVITATEVESDLSVDLNREFIATTPTTLILQTERSILQPGESSAIYAIVRDKNDNPVKNQRINFNLFDAINGKLSNGSATTNALGQASIIYTAGDSASAERGVTIEASLSAYQAITDSIDLSVGNRAFNIVLGEDENLSETGTSYRKEFGVIVTDNSGNPVENQLINFSVIPIEYGKGSYYPTNECYESSDDTSNNESNSKWAITRLWCPSEDTNRNGSLDNGEDYNGNGYLEPRNAASITASDTTNENGQATAFLTYLQSHASWSKVRITATIQSAGTEHQASVVTILSPLAKEYDNCDISPPNVISPWGTDACEAPSPYSE